MDFPSYLRIRSCLVGYFENETAQQALIKVTLGNRAANASQIFSYIVLENKISELNNLDPGTLWLYESEENSKNQLHPSF